MKNNFIMGVCPLCDNITDMDNYCPACDVYYYHITKGEEEDVLSIFEEEPSDDEEDDDFDVDD